MQSLGKDEYLDKLKERGKNKRVTRDFQFIGLEIATTLRDLKHKALYIKLAKQHNPDKLLTLAKDVADRRDVKNLGAYFMKLVTNMRQEANNPRISKPNISRRNFFQ